MGSSESRGVNSKGVRKFGSYNSIDFQLPNAHIHREAGRQTHRQPDRRTANVKQKVELIIIPPADDGFKTCLSLIVM